MKKAVIASVIACTMTLPAMADEALPDLLKTLRDNGTIDQQTYERLEHKAAAPVPAPSSTAMRAKTKGGLLEFESADGAFSAALGGRLEIDAAAYHTHGSGNEMGNGTQIRRARLYAEGTIYRDWKYKNEIDFAGGSVSLTDVYLRYTGLPVAFTVGNFKEPFSLEQLTSDRYLTFMERALVDVFSPGRNIGIGAAYHGARYSAALGVFGKGFNSPNSSSHENDEGIGVTGRLTFNPLLDKDRLVHLGIAASHRTTGDAGELRFQTRPETHISDLRLVDTGTLAQVNSFSLLGLEAATVLGPFSLQGEYMLSHVERDHARDPLFNGWYAEATYALTGEARPYSAATGTFSRPHPQHPLSAGGIGEWELGVRLSSLDLNDNKAGVHGGRERNAGLALNWYPESNLRFAANYIKVLKVDGGPHAHDEPSIFQVRAQVDF
ncbi:MAG TPA: porin [Nitrococcus sp.]|nr:porin [Nitrococcus sp.]